MAEGILVSGSPGSGKSTFAAALAEFYGSKGNVVKTLGNRVQHPWLWFVDLSTGLTDVPSISLFQFLVTARTGRDTPPLE
jgi:energy-coupling factor transporter ATP-binding protein EcfA2